MDQSITEYIQEEYGSEDQQTDTEGNLAMWTRFEAAADAAQGMFTTRDVEDAMRASNFNKGLGPDGFDGTILRPGDASHRLTQEIAPRS